MANLTTRQRAFELNAQNENADQILRKGALQGPTAAKTMVTTRQRQGLADIGNKQLLGGIVKPARMTKQKATSNLSSKAVTGNFPQPAAVEERTSALNRPKRKLSNEKDEQPMEIIQDEPVEQVMQDTCMDVDDGNAALQEEASDVAAFSTANFLLHPSVENIDLEDQEDPQLVVDYVNEIYGYMRNLENSQSVREDYLKGQKSK